MEILLWLVPPAVVTGVAMLWVGWVGRESRGEVDREAAVRRLGRALSPPDRARGRSRPLPGYAVPPRRDDHETERSTGVAVRLSKTPPVRPVPGLAPPVEAPAAEQSPLDETGQVRRVS